MYLNKPIYDNKFKEHIFENPEAKRRIKQTKISRLFKGRINPEKVYRDLMNAIRKKQNDTSDLIKTAIWNK